MAQFKRIWLPYKKENDVSKDGTKTLFLYTPIDDEETRKADDEIQFLIAHGWKIVSTAPVTASFNFLNTEWGDIYHTFTNGIEVFLVKE
jgi:hypothetical protein